MTRTDTWRRRAPSCFSTGRICSTWRPPSTTRWCGPRAPYFRCHENHVVNLARVRSIEAEGRDRRLRLDSPVNRLLPVARGRDSALRRVLGM